jgi:hypothetical protein
MHWPQHFLVMFDLPSTLGTNPDYARAGGEAFAVLLGLIVECQNAGSLAQGDPNRLALMAWCMNHGIAKLASSSVPLGISSVEPFAVLIKSGYPFPVRNPT